MFKLKSLLVIGVSALIAGTAVGFSSGLSASDNGASAAAPTMSAPGTASAIDRTRKSDRLPVARNARGEQKTVTAVEIVGLRDVAIIYRDREGRVLFSQDPQGNTTVVTRGFVLPDVTVRDAPRGGAAPVAIDAPAKAKPAQPTVDSREPNRPLGVGPQNGGRQNTERRPRIPEGCEPAASPIAAPQLSHILSKCLVEAPVPVKLAALN